LQRVKKKLITTVFIYVLDDFFGGFVWVFYIFFLGVLFEAFLIIFLVGFFCLFALVLEHVLSRENKIVGYSRR
jgi:hypothetical protein